MHGTGESLYFTEQRGFRISTFKGFYYSIIIEKQDDCYHYRKIAGISIASKVGCKRIRMIMTKKWKRLIRSDKDSEEESRHSSGCKCDQVRKIN